MTHWTFTRSYLLFILGFLFQSGHSFGTTITSADYDILPQGEAITLTGTEFTGTTKTSFLSERQSFETTFRELSDTTLEVDFSAIGQREPQRLLVESASGSTVTSSLSEAETDQFSGTGTHAPTASLVVVKSGATLEGFTELIHYFVTDMIYVEAGGTLKIERLMSQRGIYIFAEEGATLNFGDDLTSSFFSPRFFYSPNTSIIGTPPPNSSRQLTPVSLSYGVGPFREGYAIDLTIVGPGAVSRSPAGPYYLQGDTVELTAQPDPGRFFNGWSEGVSSGEQTISVVIPSPSITASFSSGRILTVYSGPENEIIRSPDKEFYSDGETVILTPQAKPGFEFTGWAGDVSSEENPLEVAMTQDTEIIGVFRSLTQVPPPQISTANASAVSEGSTINLTGNNFTGTTAASLLWRGENSSIDFREISDTTLEVDYTPDFSKRAHVLLLENATGSTVTSGPNEDEADFFNGTGEHTSRSSVVVVKEGAGLEGFADSTSYIAVEMIYVEAGGRLVLNEPMVRFPTLVFAEDGAILDARHLDPSLSSSFESIFLSPTTVIIGTIPQGSSRQLTPLSLSFGVGPFTEGFSLDLTVVGPGSVSKNPLEAYYPQGATVELTATPDPGKTFVGWTGGITSSEETISVTIPSPPITATFLSRNTLTTVVEQGGQVIRSPDKPFYEDGELVTLTAQPQIGFKFVNWSGDVSGEENPIVVTMDGNREIIAVFELLNPNIPPHITSADHEAVPVGETITLTGTGLAGITQATFINRTPQGPVNFTSLSETTLEVEYSPWSTRGPYMLLLEAPAGSTVTSEWDEAQINRFGGTGLSPTTAPLVIVEPGATLEGFDNPDAPFLIDVIYVEAGGVLKLDFGMIAGDLYVFAEDGAILDFRSVDPPSNLLERLYYGPGTEVLGTIPNGLARQLTPISLSPGVGPFTEGHELEVISSPGGSVSRSIPGPYYERGTTVQLTAEPDPGQFFIGWTGGVTSSEETISVRVPGSPITANFSNGRILTTYSGLGGQISRTPDKAVYAEGESVTLTALAAPGYEFLGWAGAVTGEESPVALTLTENTEVIGIFRSLTQDSLPRITSADYETIPEGETVNLTGTGFTGATKASWIGPSLLDSVNFAELSDTTLEVEFSPWSPSDANMLLLESAGGSTLTSGWDEAQIFRFSGTGLSPSIASMLIVEPGAILEGFDNPDALLLIDVIYVEAGGVFKLQPWMIGGDVFIFAEDGAILDFRPVGSPSLRPECVFYSPATEVLGTIPNGSARQLTSISLSPGVGPFTEGHELEVTSSPGGSVSRSIAGPYYERGTTVQLTAEPDPGQFFIGWTGGVTSSEETISVTVPQHQSPITANFSNGRILTTYSGLGGQISRAPDKAVYADGESVTLTALAAPGYEFLGWAGAVTGKESPVALTLTENTEVIGIFRSLTRDSLPRITSADYETIPEGETVTLTGTGFAGATKASWIGPTSLDSVNFAELSDTTLEVEFSPWSPSDANMLLLESAGGSTLTSGWDEAQIFRFSGTGFSPSTASMLIVEPGAILEGFDNPDALLLIDVIYVEAGGVFKLQPWMIGGDVFIFAEDGAILDFRPVGSPSLRPECVFYSPATEVIGIIPNGSARQLTPISLSPGVGPFTEGYRVSVTVEGPGTVSGYDQTIHYYERGEEINLLATPAVGNHFIRWGGSIPSTADQLNIVVERDIQVTARFSPLVDFISDWRTSKFTSEQLADPSISGLSADPDKDGNNNTTEYVFGGDPLKADQGANIAISKVDASARTITFSYVRPRFVADVDYLYFGSSDLIEWTPLSDSAQVDEISTEVISDNQERVSLRVLFSQTLPESYSFRVSAKLN